MTTRMTLFTILLCVQLSAAELTTESLGKEIVAMQKASEEISPNQAKIFIEKFVNPIDLKRAMENGKTIEDLSAQFADSGKFAALADILKRINASDGTVNTTDNEISCKVVSDNSEGWIKFILIDGKWYIKN